MQMQVSHPRTAGYRGCIPIDRSPLSLPTHFSGRVTCDCPFRTAMQPIPPTLTAYFELVWTATRRSVNSEGRSFQVGPCCCTVAAAARCKGRSQHWKSYQREGKLSLSPSPTESGSIMQPMHPSYPNACQTYMHARYTQYLLVSRFVSR